MNMNVLRAGLLAAVLASHIAAAQQGEQGKAKPYEPRKIVITPQPVTKTEAGKILLQVNNAIVRVMPKLRPAPVHLTGTKPVTRAEVVNEFDRIFQMAKREFKFSPRKVTYEPALLTIKDKPTRDKLQKLIAW